MKPTPIQKLAEHIRNFYPWFVRKVRRRRRKPSLHVVTQAECHQGADALPALRCPYLTKAGACETFRCSKCKQLYPWCQGADDNHPDRCDQCWEDDWRREP